ncbi:MAG TPA: GNAT family protein [Symbiobacteriaceae bacterium]|nr:GNAT family protein [Symbiobacteriaceae bacterium]
MSTLTLHLVTVRDAAEIIAFEQENRAFFAQSVPDRGDEYFVPANMVRFLVDVEAEQARGECYLYLVRDASGGLVGRVNLVDVEQGSASIGYRIGAHHGGKGYASEAVRLALAEATAKGIVRVTAMTTGENVGSQIVLLRNGFQFRERRAKHLDVNGALHDAVLFEKRM